MSIILDEYEWAADAVNNRSLGKKPFETLRRVAGYYMEIGCSKSATRQRLEDYILSCNPTSSPPKWSDIIDNAISRAAKSGLVRLECVEITQSEIDRILLLEGKSVKRLAFTLLCVSKYWDALNNKNDHWANCPVSEIMAMANISTSTKRQCSMYRSLRDEGMIEFSKKVDNTNVRVNFSDNNDVVLKIVDFRNLGYQFLKYIGEPYFECEHCGITTKEANPSKGRKQRYCSSCAVEVRTQQNINSVMRHRNNA